MIVLGGDEANILWRRAGMLWGPKHERGMAMEEAAELIVATHHLMRNRPEAKEEFLEEFADALVCAGQVVNNEGWWPELTNALEKSFEKLGEKVKRLDLNYGENR